MTASFLGITAHCFSQTDRKRHNFTLVVMHFPSPHTATRIAQMLNSVLQEWNIPKTNIFRILTDNGSNMVASFKTTGLNEDLDSSGNDLQCQPIEINENINTSTSSASDDEVSDTDTTALLEESTANFEAAEVHHTTFLSTNFRRLGCFVHTLQLVVNSSVLSSNTTVKKASR